ncbi:MarR family winged helix-turn-helix transcriptional regulator [Actinomadura alba]|uniref:Winged helix DNA-binding protein n=1 Tax=Actinomadura alba TaxID=406431 RepID=A0ABR7LRK7_9ACTN|nr:MarR family transcriptional regulator [Actinomadura alba]MBC6467436.1 winged helix DNA-binding protein [Actinomadura alba]
MPTPPPETAGDPVSDDVVLGALLATAHQYARRALNEALAPLNIEARHYGVLAALDRDGPASQRRLSALLDLDKSAMVRIMDELERRGLATRNRDARDRRSYAIELTPEGRRKAREGGTAAATVGDRLFGWLEPADRERLVAMLTGIARQATGPGGDRNSGP